MKDKTKFRLLLFFISILATVLALIMPSPPYRPQPEATLCGGWEEGWRQEPELAGVAASIKLHRLSGNHKWPKTISETIEYGRYKFSTSLPCQEMMPEISRKVIYPVKGWNSKVLPNGVPPNSENVNGDAVQPLKNIPDDLVLLRCKSTTEPKRQLEFLWDGRIEESVIKNNDKLSK